MSAFTPPIDAIMRALREVGIGDLCALPDFAHVDEGSIEEVLTEFGRLAGTVIAPTDRIGDRQSSVLDGETGDVHTPIAFRPAYRRYIEGGWGAISVPLEDGGEGFPWVVGLATQELFASANLALSLNQVLTQSATELLRRWGSPQQRSRYLHRLVSGEWTGTMNLTESDAGSDLGAVRTRAEQQPDGGWAITGTKIFITWGEHDLADNIVHLVLARTPGAPPGTKGLSLFVVPKRLVNEDGSLGERNRVHCVALEEKLGIHASPTCVLEFRHAAGELIGQECNGMPAMFTMMNAARLSIGLEGVAVSERAYQQALAFARTRVQGRAPGAAAGSSTPIIAHPDVRRMLLTISSSIDAARLMVYSAAAALDEAAHHTDKERRQSAQRRADLLTPIAKAWPTDEGVRNTSLALQIHGGMGYVEETGIAQRFRDARIAPIYEGTNGIQAIDLVTRKVSRDNGDAMRALLSEIAHTVVEVNDSEPLVEIAEALGSAAWTLQLATEWIVGAADLDDPSDVLAGASHYLELAGIVIGGWLLARQAVSGLADGCVGCSLAVHHARFFAVERLRVVPGMLGSITAGAERLAASLGP